MQGEESEPNSSSPATDGPVDPKREAESQNDNFARKDGKAVQIGKKRITLAVNFNMSQQQYKLARFAKYGPPPLTQEQKLKKEKGFVLDALAVSTLSDDSGRANPKMATAIPPYNAQKDRHSKGYFEKPDVKKLLKKTDQEYPGDSIAGKQMDKFYDKGMMGDYIWHRNTAGAGHSTSQVGGHGLFMENISPLNGFNGCFGFRRNTPSLRTHPSVFIGKIDSRSVVP
ncbi:uncharacterized protein C17orf98-like [Stylophora pistillata]|nr:uncharacterized protein C17orf98-like [Stylophora pistillata]XP_022795126.1 uncharacterized protein C17orf98-like [Stylophora pistillata]